MLQAKLYQHIFFFFFWHLCIGICGGRVIFRRPVICVKCSDFIVLHTHTYIQTKQLRGFFFLLNDLLLYQGSSNFSCQ